MTEQTTEITAYERSVALVKAELTQYKPKQIDTVLGLLQDGNTVPFIARYRKDQTGSLDEVQIREIEERQRYLENFEKRKEEISRLIDEQGKTDARDYGCIKQGDNFNGIRRYLSSV